MTSAQMLKQKLLVEIEKLPEYRLQEVLDFVSFLSQKSRYSPKYQEQGKELDTEEDPILQFIGGVSHGSLAQGIDEELYGL
jgi:hypothetical protein